MESDWRHTMAITSDGKLYGWGWNKVKYGYLIWQFCFYPCVSLLECNSLETPIDPALGIICGGDAADQIYINVSHGPLNYVATKWYRTPELCGSFFLQDNCFSSTA
ncbi:uncharacterized protein LOC131239830 isoform X1 [Magnolia sinica]|uniref:uncharacterized protein LOC131239830 isoform X1 n=1 Tax=Magnolia sinica TaxID=86752 RepID=UPI002659A56C|nr:uncharacterized protein LOC131239830 isoform X1 [Magnolia sinica]